MHASDTGIIASCSTFYHLFSIILLIIYHLSPIPAQIDRPHTPSRTQVRFRAVFSSANRELSIVCQPWAHGQKQQKVTDTLKPGANTFRSPIPPSRIRFHSGMLPSRQPDEKSGLLRKAVRLFSGRLQHSAFFPRKTGAERARCSAPVCHLCHIDLHCRKSKHHLRRTPLSGSLISRHSARIHSSVVSPLILCSGSG